MECPRHQWYLSEILKGVILLPGSLHFKVVPAWLMKEIKAIKYTDEKIFVGCDFN